MKQLLYMAITKLGEFFPNDGTRIIDRISEAEISAFGAALRIATSENPDSESLGQRFEQVLAYAISVCDAQTMNPTSCEDLYTWDWLEFRGFFEYGARLRDWGLDDRGVYTFTSREIPACSLRNEEECSEVQIILCGSREHVLTEPASPPKRMGSGSDWLHDLAAVLVEREARGDVSLPDELRSTSRRDKEFAARSAFDMLAPMEGPAYLHGHARVLCNFPPGIWPHRLIVATPLYVEAVSRPQRSAIESTAGDSATPARRRFLPHFMRRTT